ncbi:hypothetical protein ACF09H_22475 [Streptomyces sp. NPDC014983]
MAPHHRIRASAAIQGYTDIYPVEQEEQEEQDTGRRAAGAARGGGRHRP